MHSTIPCEDQEAAFVDPRPQTTHVVLATDMAESSITLTRVILVVDLGLHCRIGFRRTQGLSSLATKWISQAAAI